MEGGDLIPTTNEYKNLLESTAIRIEEEDKGGEKEGFETPRKVKAMKTSKNPWKKDFVVKEIIAKSHEDNPSTMTAETETLVTMTYKDEKGDEKSVQMTQKEMNVYNAIMQGVGMKIKEQEKQINEHKKNSDKAIEKVTSKVEESTKELKQKQSENEEKVKQLKAEVQQQQVIIEQMDKNQGERIEQCQNSVRNDIAELKELMLNLATVSEKPAKRDREVTNVMVIEPMESPTKKQMKTRVETQQNTTTERDQVKIKQEMIDEAATQASENKDYETKSQSFTIDLFGNDDEEEPEEQEEAKAKGTKKKKASVVLSSLGRTAKSLGVGSSFQNNIRQLRNRTDKSNSQSGESLSPNKAARESPRRGSQRRSS